MTKDTFVRIMRELTEIESVGVKDEAYPFSTEDTVEIVKRRAANGTLREWYPMKQYREHYIAGVMILAQDKLTEIAPDFVDRFPTIGAVQAHPAYQAIVYAGIGLSTPFVLSSEMGKAPYWQCHDVLLYRICRLCDDFLSPDTENYLKIRRNFDAHANKK